MKTPNYVLCVSHRVHISIMDYIELQAGMFVRPIQIGYVPDHVISKYKKTTMEDYCYTSKGILPIPRNIIRET